MKLALIQFNPTIGALTANADRLLALAAEAEAQQPDLIVFPELALTGYPPRDLLLQGGFIEAVMAQARRIAAAAPREALLVFGLPWPVDESRPDGHRLHNSLCACRDGQIIALYHKRLLPTYDVFDEDRYFEPGSRGVILSVSPRAGGTPVRVGLSICEDLWRGEDVGFASRYLNAPDPVAELVTPPDGSLGAQVIVNPSASPFRLGTGQRHRALLSKHARAHGVFVAAVNQVGANDELVFDGHAAVFDPQGSLIAAGPGFVEAITTVDLHPGAALASVADPLTTREPEELLFHALVLGVRDYCRKTGFKTAVLGLSGGIDSALVAVLAAAALGPAAVTGLALPSRYSSQGSLDDAAELSHRLGLTHHVLPIEPPFAAMLASLEPLFTGRDADVTEENLQSRIRGTLLMAMSNKFGHLLLTTGNKSELAVGYCTLYGDMNGGLAVISDVAKMQVYALSRWINQHWPTLGIPGLQGPPIPENTLAKAPSAELRPNQTDQDSLPPYEVLDEIIERAVERREATGTIISAMASQTTEATIRRVLRLIEVAEFKRKQAAIGLKVTSVAFGSGRRMPIAQGWRSDRQ